MDEERGYAVEDRMNSRSYIVVEGEENEKEKAYYMDSGKFYDV